MTFWHTSIDGSWKFKINKQGFRSNYDFEYEKKPGTLRILVLGDSHTQGFEVRQDYTYSAILEKYLNSHGVKAEVYNMGIAGFSTAEELIFLENEGVKYSPDIVILGFFANDLEDNVKADLFAVVNDELVLKKKEHIPGVKYLDIIYSIPFTKWLSQRSYLFSVFFNEIWDISKKQLYKNKRGELSTEYAIPISKINNYQITLVRRLIERMYDFCKENKYYFIILNIPGTKGPMKEESFLHDNSADIVLDGNTILSDYSGVVELHVPHGHRHISEFTHLLIGQSLATRIMTETVQKHINQKSRNILTD